MDAINPVFILYSLFLYADFTVYNIEKGDLYTELKYGVFFIFNQPCKENLKLDREIWRYEEEEEEEISSW